MTLREIRPPAAPRFESESPAPYELILASQFRIIDTLGHAFSGTIRAASAAALGAEGALSGPFVGRDRRGSVCCGDQCQRQRSLFPQSGKSSGAGAKDRRRIRAAAHESRTNASCHASLPWLLGEQRISGEKSRRRLRSRSTGQGSARLVSSIRILAAIWVKPFHSCYRRNPGYSICM